MELPAPGENVSLAWNASANPEVAGYNVYFWIKGNAATNKVYVGQATSITISNLVVGRTYCFAATAYDADGLESPLSNEVSFTMPPPPLLNIVTPAANQQWTNGGFTMAGKASDNVAVATVYYALNGSAWTAATTTNRWTNWMANLILTPGTNVLQTRAVDPFGNISATNTVRLVYLVLKPLTVQIAGRGSVNPNYNGILLAIGRNYTLAASAAPGFAFTKWTDSAGNLLTNRATLGFTMTTNLAFTANFTDVTGPTLNIVSPTSNQQRTNGTFTATGRAGDNVTVRAAYYSLNGSAWTMPATTNNWTNWTANLILSPGTNILQACAVDTSGNYSATSTVRFVYLVLKPLTVQIAGRGYVNPNYNGTRLAINENYTMTAFAAPGFAFTNWTDATGKVVTNRATVGFTMVTNLALAANFVDVTRPTLSLVAPAPNLRVSNTMFTVTGRAGDNVAVGTVHYSLNGSAWTAATTTNNWTNWSARVILKSWTNTIQAYAVDTSGNTSPTNRGTVNLVVPPAASATLNSATWGNGQCAFMVSGAAGYKYLVQASSDLVNWVPLQTNTAPFTFVDPNTDQFSQRFYRTIFNP